MRRDAGLAEEPPARVYGALVQPGAPGTETRADEQWGQYFTGIDGVLEITDPRGRIKDSDPNSTKLVKSGLRRNTSFELAFNVILRPKSRYNGHAYPGKQLNLGSFNFKACSQAQR